MSNSSALKPDLLRFDLKVWVVVLAHARMIGSPPNSMQQAFWAKYHAKLITNLDPVAREHVELLSSALLGAVDSGTAQPQGTGFSTELECKRKNSADQDSTGTAREAISLRQFAKERTRMH